MLHCWLGHGGPRLQPRRPKIPNLRWITGNHPVKSTAARHPKSEAVQSKDLMQKREKVRGRMEANQIGGGCSTKRFKGVHAS